MPRKQRKLLKDQEKIKRRVSSSDTKKTANTVQQENHQGLIDLPHGISLHSLTPDTMQQLQRTMGNQALTQMIAPAAQNQANQQSNQRLVQTKPQVDLPGKPLVTIQNFSPNAIQRKPPDEVTGLLDHFIKIDVIGKPVEMGKELVRLIYGETVEVPEKLVGPDIRAIVSMIHTKEPYQPWTPEEQKKYQGSLWNVYKSLFRSGRNEKDSPLKPEVFGPIKAFFSNRVTPDGRLVVIEAAKLAIGLCSEETVLDNVLAFAEKNMDAIKTHFIEAFNQERNLEANAGINEQINQIKINENVMAFLKNAIAKIVQVIKSKQLDIFFDQSGPGGASGGTPNNKETPADVMNAKKMPNLSDGEKYTLSVNLSETTGEEELKANLIPSIDVATTIFHELMHIAGGNLGESGGGGHLATLQQYLNMEDVGESKDGDNANEKKEAGVEIPALFIDAYFMESIWHLYMKEKKK